MSQIGNQAIAENKEECSIQKLFQHFCVFANTAAFYTCMFNHSYLP